jgi:hypothetical protein
VAVGVIAGVGSGALAALFAPWAQGRVDERRLRRESQAKVIAGARELVHEGQDMDRSVLLRDPRYLAIRPYLPPEVESQLHAQELTVVSDPYGTVGNPYLALIRNEADRLEKKWRLL